MLYAVGTIVSGKSGFDPLNGAVVGSDTIVEQIRRVRDDDSIKAIVLRVDSPGGSSVASDVIWRELMITRDRSRRGRSSCRCRDLAASGGYYIAMPGQVIVAQPATLTGSIGIFAGKIVIGGTLEKLGVTTETVQSGANADINSPFDAVHARAAGEAAGVHAGLLRRTSSRRSPSRARRRRSRSTRWRRAACGPVSRRTSAASSTRWAGSTPPIAIAKERAKIPADEDVELVVYPPRRSFYEALSRAVRRTAQRPEPLLAAETQPGRSRALTAPVRLFRAASRWR